MDNFKIRMYYTPSNIDPSVSDSATLAQYRISPCPEFDIETRYKYANDHIIGYDYVINLKGFATSVDVAKDQFNTGLNLVSTRIQNIRNIFSHNGGNLRITSPNNTNYLLAKGGVVKNITFDQSDNFWVNYTPYTIQIVFNEIHYGTECSTTIPSNEIYGGCNDPKQAFSPNSLIDTTQHKIESFSDSWSFTLDENIYNTFYDTGIDVKNEHFNVQYKISAVGQTYFNGQSVMPAWEQAKNFCQDRLHKFVTVFMKGILTTNNTDGCEPAKTLQNLHTPSSVTSNSGLINLARAPDNYNIYNERVTCETSQSDGSFSLVYKSIVKKDNTSSQFATGPSLHTFSLNKSITNDNANKSITMTLNGTIQGLLEGGIINSPNVIKLPNAGTLFIHNTPNNETPTPYNNALFAYNKIKGGSIKFPDLSDDFKKRLGIININFGVNCNPQNTVKCSTHSVSHNYGDGTISYTAEFNNRTACIGDITTNPIRNIIIEQKDPIPRIAEYVVPGRALGPIVQKLGSDESRIIDIKIEGVDPNLKCCFSPDVILNEISELATHRYLPAGLPAEDIANLVLTQNTYNANPLDGSFSVQRSYICCDANVFLPGVP